MNVYSLYDNIGIRIKYIIAKFKKKYTYIQIKNNIIFIVKFILLNNMIHKSTTKERAYLGS